MRKINLIFIVIMLFFFAGCTVNQYIILRDVPDNPSFMVIPNGYNTYEIDYANRIERFIIQSGTKVVNRPSREFVIKNVLFRDLDLDVEESDAIEQVVIERLSAYKYLDADYLIFSFYHHRNIRVVKRTTKEVLAVLPVSRNRELGSQDIEKALRALGLSIADR